MRAKYNFDANVIKKTIVAHTNVPLSILLYYILHFIFFSVSYILLCFYFAFNNITFKTNYLYERNFIFMIIKISERNFKRI